MATFPALDLTRLDLSKIRLPKVDLPTLDLSSVKVPALPNVSMPTAAELPRVDLPTVDTERVVEVARDAAYVGIGLAVLGFQQAQVRRRQLIGAVKRLRSSATS